MKSGQMNSLWDGIKWVFVWLLVAAIIAANYYYSDQAVTLRIIWSLLAFIVILVLAFFTEKGQRFWTFAKASRIELRKIVWPTRQETLQSTMLIVIVVVVTALFLWGIDSVLLWGVRFFTGQRG